MKFCDCRGGLNTQPGRIVPAAYFQKPASVRLLHRRHRGTSIPTHHLRNKETRCRLTRGGLHSIPVAKHRLAIPPSLCEGTVIAKTCWWVRTGWRIFVCRMRGGHAVHKHVVRGYASCNDPSESRAGLQPDGDDDGYYKRTEGFMRRVIRRTVNAVLPSTALYWAQGRVSMQIHRECTPVTTALLTIQLAHPSIAATPAALPSLPSSHHIRITMAEIPGTAIDSETCNQSPSQACST
jgi:hypothetical protein